MSETVLRELTGHNRIHLVPPLGYGEFVAALLRSHFVLTDSGGIQEEAPALGKPVLVMRGERPQALDAGVAPSWAPMRFLSYPRQTDCSRTSQRIAIWRVASRPTATDAPPDASWRRSPRCNRIAAATHNQLACSGRLHAPIRVARPIRVKLHGSVLHAMLCGGVGAHCTAFCQGDEHPMPVLHAM